MMAELLPCPFCGGEPYRLDAAHSTAGVDTIACRSCGCRVFGGRDLEWNARAQLEAQRGELARDLDLTKREAWTAKERHKDERDRADGLRERLDELSAEEFARAQRGGAVVVPAKMDDDDWEAIGFQQSTEGQLQRVWDRAVSRIQPIPADRVLADGMVGVDRERLAALEAISDKIEALALGPDGRAWTPLHYREFARGELRRAQQAKGES